MVDILFVTRGRGRGHATTDAAIVKALHEIDRDVSVQFASYSVGCRALIELGYVPIDFGLHVEASFPQVALAVGNAIRLSCPRIVVAHEEPAAMTIGKLLNTRTVFLTHWFAWPENIGTESLEHADRIIFLERQGIFYEPSQVKGRILYTGPLIRPLDTSTLDFEEIRRSLGIDLQTKLIVILPGSTPEVEEPIFQLALSAFDALHARHKRLIWVGGSDTASISAQVGCRGDVAVVEFEPYVERVAFAADLVITKGTYNTCRELEALGIDFIALSFGNNFVDDCYLRLSSKARVRDPKLITISELTSEMSRTRQHARPRKFQGTAIQTVANDVLSVLHGHSGKDKTLV